MTTVDMTDRYQREYFQVCQLKGVLKLINAGLQPPRGVRKKDLMITARRLTGGSFGVQNYAAAITALEARRDALLVYMRPPVDG